MKKTAIYIILVALGLFLNACAFDVIHVKQTPAQLNMTQPTKDSFVLVKEIDFELDTSFPRKLKKGTRWDFVGTLPQGDVFKTKDQVLTVEGSNIFEAYIVLSSKKLVGFYLPVEKTFSPLAETQDLDMKKVNSNP